MFVASRKEYMMSNKTANKQTANKQTANKQTASKQTASKQTASKQTAEQQTAEQQTAVKSVFESIRVLDNDSKLNYIETEKKLVETLHNTYKQYVNIETNYNETNCLKVFRNDDLVKHYCMFAIKYSIKNSDIQLTARLNKVTTAKALESDSLRDKVHITKKVNTISFSINDAEMLKLVLALYITIK